MAEASIPVDLFNPGQVFACLGFLEAAEVLLGDAEGGFDWSEETQARFRLRAPGEESPISSVLEFIANARVLSLAPAGSDNSTESPWQVPTELLGEDAPFPFPDPASPATLPAVLEGSSPGKDGKRTRIAIDHWGEDKRTGRDHVKFWGGAGGYPGAAVARDAIHLVRARCREAASDPFQLSAEQSSSFRLDWRRDYIPIDAGFSVNKHSGRIATVGYPLVELLAAVGLTNARPLRKHVLEYRYGVIGSGRPSSKGNGSSPLFAPSLVRAALGCAHLPFQRRNFRMFLGWPAQEGQARAITIVTEEADQ